METGRQRRVSKSAAIYIPIGALVIILLTILGISSFLSITDIEVIGATRYTADDIISVSGIGTGDNLLFLDTEFAERRIITAMPFVSTVSISRIPPNSVLIEVSESVPIAAVSARGDILVIDSSGRILEQVNRMPEGIIEIRGITPVDAAPGMLLRTAPEGEMQLQYMRDVLVALEREGITDDVSYLDVTHIAQINFGYMGRFRVILGDPSNLRQKLELLPTSIEQINEDAGENAIGDINLTDPGLGVRWTRVQ